MTPDPIDIEASAGVLRVLANPSRLRIALRLLAGEQAVSELESGLGIRQPTLSQHLAELRDNGVVATRRDSRAVFYRLADADQRRLVASLLQGFGAVLPMAPPASSPTVLRRTTPAATFAILENRQ